MPNAGWLIMLQPISRDPKDNGVAAMLDDRTFCFVIHHGRHTIVFLISRDWLQTTHRDWGLLEGSNYWNRSAQ